MSGGRVLVTGATGLLGNNVVRMLLERGEQVRVLVRESADPRPLEGLDVELAVGDVRDRESVAKAVSGVRAIIHSAAWVHITWSHLELAREINVRGTCHVADAARAAGARLIHVSTIDTLGPGSRDQPADEETPGQKTECSYVISKREAEEEIATRVASGLDAVIVNPGFMVGPWDWKPSSGRMLLHAATGFALLAPSGGISLCDPRDVALGIFSAIERGQTGRRYILAGENMSYREAWRRFAALAGRRGPIAHLGPIASLVAGCGGDLWTRITGRETDVNSAAIAMSRLWHCYSSARATAELGYHNRPTAESLRDAWEWFGKHGKLAKV